RPPPGDGGGPAAAQPGPGPDGAAGGGGRPPGGGAGRGRCRCRRRGGGGAMTVLDAPPITDGLRLEGITVRFGGHVAVNGLSLAAPVRRITGLIGPNGAGKTTTFNACSGLQSVASGRVYLDGEDVTGLGPAPRAHRGLGRTFQRMELFDSMIVVGNVGAGREARLAGL